MNNSRQFGKNVFTFIRRIEKLYFFLTAALLLFYLTAVPVKFALVLRISAQPCFGAGLSLFEGRFALRSARKRALGEKKRLSWRKSGREIEKNAALPAVLRALRYLLRRIRLEQLRAEGRVSSPDAAQTALACGCIRSLEGMLRPFLPAERLCIRLNPDFSASDSDVRFSCMLSVRLGHIILTALIGAWHYIIRRISHGKASD